MKLVLPSGASIVEVDEPNRTKKWRLSLGRRITGGKRQRTFHQTYSDAAGVAKAAVEARKQKGEEALLLKSGEMHEASLCVQRLKEYGATLTAATDYYIRHHRPSHMNRTFAQVAAEILRRKRKTNRRNSTLKSYAGYFRRFSADHKNLPIARITQKNMEAWLDDLDIGPETYKNYIRNLGIVWNFAVENKYVTESILTNIELPKQDEEPAEILTPGQAKALLAQASQPEWIAWLPYLAISLFAGLRTNEVQQLDWQQIDFEGKLITVTPHQAKTRRRRFVQMSGNLLSWLKRVKPASRSGPVVPFEGNPFWDGREKLRQAAGMTEWPKNVLRHSFGSYHLARHNDEGLTATQMGNSPAVVIKNYREMVKPSDAEAYWKLAPSSKA